MKLIFVVLVGGALVSCMAMNKVAMNSSNMNPRNIAAIDAEEFPFVQAEQYGIGLSDVKDLSCARVSSTGHTIAYGTANKTYRDPQTGCTSRIECHFYSTKDGLATEISGLLTGETSGVPIGIDRGCSEAAESYKSAPQGAGYCTATNMLSPNKRTESCVKGVKR